MRDAVRHFQYQGRDSLALPAERAAFTTLKVWLSGIADELKLPARSGKQILIAADEIFTNIASYGYPEGGGKADVSVEFDLAAHELVVTFFDSGIAYNPLEADPPKLDKPLAERQAGGLGLFMVKKMMDSVEYHRRDGRNVVILKKRLEAVQ